MPKMIKARATKICVNNTGFIRIEKGKFYKFTKKIDNSYYKIVDIYGNSIIITYEEFSKLFVL